MDKYTRKYFFDKIEDILNNRSIEETHPVFIFFAKDGLPTLLDSSGNKAIGNILGILETIFGYIGEGGPTTAVPGQAVLPGQVMEFCQQCGALIGTRDE